MTKMSALGRAAGPYLFRVALAFALLTLLSRSALAWWTSDQRLTNDPFSSYTATNNARSVACDAHRRVHVVWTDDRAGDIRNFEIYYKLYDGASWGADERLTYSQSAYNPSVAVDTTGNVHVVWEDDRDGNWEIYHKLYDGVSWGVDERLTSYGGDSKCPSMTVDRSGHIHLVWYDNRDGNYEIYRKLYDGVHWGPDQRLTDHIGGSYNPSVAVDGSGHIHVVWYDDRDGNLEIYHKLYNGTTWGPDERLTSDGNASYWPSASADARGNVHVVWNDNRDGNFEIYDKQYDGVAWGADERLTNNAGASYWASVAADGSGNVHVVWFDDRDGGEGREIYHKMYDGASWGADERLTDNWYYSIRPSVAVADSGDVHVVWQDNRDNSQTGVYEIYYKRWTPPVHTISSLSPSVAGNIFPVSAVVTGTGFMAPARVWLKREGQSDIGAQNVVVVSPSYITCDFDLCGASRGSWHLFVKNPDDQEGVLENALVVFDTPWGEEERVTNDVFVSLTSANGARCVAREASGVVHAVWCSTKDGNCEIYHRMWDGNTWPAERRLTTDGGSSMHPSIALGIGGNLHLCWKDNRDGNWEIYYKLCNGGVWGGDQRLTNAAGPSEYPSLTVDASGNPLIVFQDSRAGNLEIYCVRWDGSGWLEERLTGNSAISEFPTAASDSSGNTSVFWEDTRDGNSEIHFKIWNGVSWTSDMRLSSTQGTSTRPTAGCDNRGRVMVAWEEYTGSDAAVNAKLCDRGVWTDLGRVCPTGRNPSVCGDGLGRFLLAWQDDHDGHPAIFTKCYSTVWTSEARITGGAAPSEQPSVAADALGKAAVVWQDSRNQNLEIYARRWEGDPETAGIAAPDAEDQPSALEGIAPNPVTSTAELLLNIGSRSAARLCVYDVMGRLVWARGIEAGEPGPRRIVWNGKDLVGNRAAAGVYFVRLEMGPMVSSAKMVILR